MNDILQRLKNLGEVKRHFENTIYADAAAEIERLREQVKGLEDDLRMVRSGRDCYARLIEERGLRTPKEAAAFNRKRGKA